MVKNPSAGAGDAGLIPGLGRSLGVRAWQPTPVFLPGEYPLDGESHGQRSLVVYSSQGCKESDTTLRCDKSEAIYHACTTCQILGIALKHFSYVISLVHQNNSEN